MNGDPFTSFRAFEDALLDGMKAGERSAKKFKHLIGTINETLVTTHNLVINRLKAIEGAPDVTTAKRLLEELRGGELAEAFRVEGLCDLLQGLGEGLLTREGDARHEGLFNDGQLDEVKQFGWMLASREDEVARQYAESLQELVGHGVELNEHSLEALRSEAATLRAQLTDDVSDFQAKAKVFKQTTTS